MIVITEAAVLELELSNEEVAIAECDKEDKELEDGRTWPEVNPAGANGVELAKDAFRDPEGEGLALLDSNIERSDVRRLPVGDEDGVAEEAEAEADADADAGCGRAAASAETEEPVSEAT